MRTLLTGLLVGVAVGAGAPSMHDRTSVEPQARDAGAPPVIGTATISGVVEDDAQPARPVRRAIVTLVGEGLHPSRGAITDEEGRFLLRGLPAGRFTLTVERGGYVTSAYGAKRPGRAGTAITIGDGQRMTDVRVRLWRGAVLSGVVRDESGQPLPNMAVAAVPTREVAPVSPTFSNRDEARSNDLGEYRIFGLEPGTYVVRAAGGMMLRAETAASEADVDRTFAALAARRTQAGALVGSAEPVRVVSPAVSLAPVYFPGTPVPADAIPITLAAGEERGGLDFVVQRIRISTIRGTVAGPDGVAIPRAFLQLAPAERPASFPGAAPPPVTGYATEGGAFEIGPVSPGDYRLIVRGEVSAAATRGRAASDAHWWTDAPVHITGDDVDLGRLTLEPGVSVAGRVVIDDGSVSPPPALAGLRVEFQAESLAVAPSSSRGRAGPGPRFLRPGIVAADGSFVVADLVPDAYDVTVTGGPLAGSRWWLRTALLDGRDLLDTPLAVTRGDDVRGLRLVLSDRRAELSGTLTTPAGAAYSDVFVLVFPSEAALRRPGSRRVSAVRPDSSGRFVFTNLPPGAYLLAALTDIDDGQWHEPGFFDSLAGVSVPVAIGEGERKVQDLRVGGG